MFLLCNTSMYVTSTITAMLSLYCMLHLQSLLSSLSKTCCRQQTLMCVNNYSNDVDYTDNSNHVL